MIDVVHESGWVINLWHPAEQAIDDARQKLERAGAHLLLTDALILLNPLTATRR